MKMNESIKEISKTVPESFYDALAYLIPGTFLIICPFFIVPEYHVFVQKYYNASTIVFDKIIIVILVLFLSYVLGQVLTTLSWIILGIIMGYFSKLFKITCWTYKKNENWTPFDNDFDRDWTQDYISIRNKNPQIGLEVTKRYGRFILSRNNVIVGITLIFLSIYFSEKTILLSSIFTSLFLFDSYLRRCWLLSYIEKTNDKLD